MTHIKFESNTPTNSNSREEIAKSAERSLTPLIAPPLNKRLLDVSHTSRIPPNMLHTSPDIIQHYMET